MKTKIFSGILFALGGNLVWALNSNLLKLISQDALNPITITSLRVLFASIFLIGIFIYYRRRNKKEIFLPVKNRKYLIYMGLAFASATVCWMAALTYTTIANVLIIGCSGMIFTLTIGHYWLHEKMNTLKIGAVLLAVCGIAIIIMPDLQFNLLADKKIMLGNFFALANSFLFSLWYLFSRKLGKESHTILTTTGSNIIAALILLPWAIYSIFNLHVAPKDWLLIITTGIMAQGFGTLLLNSALRRLEAAVGSLIGTTEIVFGIIIAFFIFHEFPFWYTYLGGVIIMIAVGISAWAQHQQYKKNPAD